MISRVRARAELAFRGPDELCLYRRAMRWLRRLGARFGYAGRGLGLAARQTNLRVMGVVAVVVVAVAAAYDVSAATWAILLLCIGAVLSAELLNSAIETLADRVEPEEDPAIRNTKDIAAGAVLVISAVAAVAGVVVLWPYVFG